VATAVGVQIMIHQRI